MQKVFLPKTPRTPNTLQARSKHLHVRAAPQGCNLILQLLAEPSVDKSVVLFAVGPVVLV